MADWKDDSGPAFPRISECREFPVNGGPVTEFYGVDGLTKREWFAGQALPALVTSAFAYNEKDPRNPPSWPVDFDEIASRAFACADAMIKAGERGA